MRFPYSGNGTWTPDYHCGFIDAVKRFFIGYMEFRGRSSRREFWLAMLFFIPVSVLIFLIPAAGTVSGILWMLATMVPIMAISFRRLHDANRTGWWFLLGHVGTILALAMLVIIAFGLVIIEIGMIMVIPHEPPKLDFHNPKLPGNAAHAVLRQPRHGRHLADHPSIPVLTAQQARGRPLRLMFSATSRFSPLPALPS